MSTPKTVYKEECLGGEYGRFSLEIRLGYPRELTKNDQHAIYEAVDLLKKRLWAEHCRVDPKKQQAKQEWLAEARKLFADAGLSPIWIEEIPNEYWGAEAVHDPWLMVTTPIGRFKIGWRKRVIHLEWTDTVVKKTADEIFPLEDVTKEKFMIHCWGTEKALLYIRRIASEAR